MTRLWFLRLLDFRGQWNFKNKFGDLTSGPVIKNIPCRAGDVCSVPGQGTKIPQAVEQLSPWATTRVQAPQERIPRGETKTHGSQINK